MPRNKPKKTHTRTAPDPTPRKAGEEYARVCRLLGNARMEARCVAGTVRLGAVRGLLRRRVWVNVGDVVVLSVRDPPEKADVVRKYNVEEVRRLAQAGEIPHEWLEDNFNAPSESEGMDTPQDSEASSGPSLSSL
uniref:S1-like domain-containing protein n=1 Tax=Arcella intermedia TaxID=1963864 RepID=A0A6B2LRA7_9EUKA